MPIAVRRSATVRSLLMLMVPLLLATALTGCGSKRPERSGPVTPTASTKATRPPAAPAQRSHPAGTREAFVWPPAPVRYSCPCANLRAGSDPKALPGPVLIADHLNNRLLVVQPDGTISWSFPRPGDLPAGQTFEVPDDAFFTPDGHYILATQEDDFVISLIDVTTDRIVWRYGTPGVPGMGPDQLNNPDDAIMAPNGEIILADIKNCRLLILRPPVLHPLRIYGIRTNDCLHDPPLRWGSPNGAFPMSDGHYIVTEINGDWVDDFSLSGRVAWSTHPPGVGYPSDTNEVKPNLFLTADYSDPGQIVEFTPSGRLVWRFRGSGADVLDRPSLAMPLPNGDILANDDYNDRVIVIDPHQNRIVWQYGHTGVPGTAPGYLNDPDGVDLAPPHSLAITHAATIGLLSLAAPAVPVPGATP